MRSSRPRSVSASSMRVDALELQHEAALVRPAGRDPHLARAAAGPGHERAPQRREAVRPVGERLGEHLALAALRLHHAPDRPPGRRNGRPSVQDLQLAALPRRRPRRRAPCAARPRCALRADDPPAVVGRDLELDARPAVARRARCTRTRPGSSHELPGERLERAASPLGSPRRALLRAGSARCRRACAPFRSSTAPARRRSSRPRGSCRGS